MRSSIINALVAGTAMVALGCSAQAASEDLGRSAQALSDDGSPCTTGTDCTSGYCYPGPDQNYCIAASSNCAQPGTAGVYFGQSYSYKGTVYNCVSGVGLQAAGTANGSPCT